MDKKIKKYWEEYLSQDKNEKFKNNWEKLSKRYGKKDILELFLNGFERVNNGEDFKGSFNLEVSSKLKKKKGQGYMNKKTTFVPLMSLFGKFRHFLKDYNDGLLDNLFEKTESGKKVQKETKENIVKTFISKKDQINPWEKRYMEINEVGDVVAPGSNFIETKNENIEGEQLKLDF
ncbi:MAG TPA: hypothetical protein VJ892_01890 [Candidatus Absconditabacterales bacterium]|nr:hypothetical protein [Candidatus Absconditabacterales bacterium]